jgi:hypothetical protein
MKGNAMGTIALYRSFHHGIPMSPSREAPAGAHEGILRRIFAAIERSQQRRAEQEAGRFIARHGGRLTDEIERQLTEHLGGGRGFAP